MRVLVFLLLVAAASGEQIERCWLAKRLKQAGMDGYAGVSLGEWVCLVEHESRYIMNIENQNRDGSRDYGLFQINSRWWCKNNDGRPTRNGCNIECKRLLNNLWASITCAKRVVRDPRGVSAWVAWRSHCRGRDVSRYIQGCGV